MPREHVHAQCLCLSCVPWVCSCACACAAMVASLVATLFLIAGVNDMRWLVGPSTQCSLSQCCNIGYAPTGRCFSYDAAALTLHNTPALDTTVAVPALFARISLVVAILLEVALLILGPLSTVSATVYVRRHVLVLLSGAAGGVTVCVAVPGSAHFAASCRSGCISNPRQSR